MHPGLGKDLPDESIYQENCVLFYASASAYRKMTDINPSFLAVCL